LILYTTKLVEILVYNYFARIIRTQGEHEK
jgi:hypothetical protein